jgi:hypothetical protein
MTDRQASNRSPGDLGGKLACRIFGHRPVFRAEGRTMYWECERGCGEGGGSKQYGTPDEARSYAAAFDRRDAADLGKRAPWIGLLPLRLWRTFRGTRT